MIIDDLTADDTQTVSNNEEEEPMHRSTEESDTYHEASNNTIESDNYHDASRMKNLVMTYGKKHSNCLAHQVNPWVSNLIDRL